MKQFASLLIVGALSLSVSSAYATAQAKEHIGVEIQGLNVRIADSVSGQTIGNLDRSLETTNSAQNIEGSSLVYQNSSVQLDDGNTPQLDNNLVGGALQDHSSDQGNVVDQQLDNRPIGVALRLGQQLDDPPVAEYLSQNLKSKLGSL